MQRKILIAVDGSLQSKGALTYVAGIFKNYNDIQFSLFHVQPIISQYLLAEARTDSNSREELQRVIDRQTVDSNELLEKARDHFVRQGIETKLTKLVSQVRRQGKAKDIIDYAHQHLFDAIVVGRRGLSRIQKAFMGSTSAKIVEHAASIPVWIIDGDVRPRNFLVPIDISETSMQLVNYLGSMLGSRPEIQMTFFHVDETPSASRGQAASHGTIVDSVIEKGELHWQNSFWVAAKSNLEQAGIHGSRVKQLTVPRTGRVAKMILEEVQAADYDTIVLGRRGSGNAFFFGSVSHYVMERLTDRALWLIG